MIVSLAKIKLQGIHSDVRGRQPNISDTVNVSDLFLRKNRDRLAPKQNENLGTKSGTLRKDYDEIYNQSEDWLKEALDQLHRLQMDEDQRVREIISIIRMMMIIIIIVIIAKRPLMSI